MPDRNREADRLFSKVVRARGACERCGRETVTECAHIIRRRYLRTRWVLDNAWCLCKDCHQMVDEHSLEFASLVVETIGGARYRELRDLAHSKTPLPDRAEVRAEMRALLKEIA